MPKRALGVKIRRRAPESEATLGQARQVAEGIQQLAAALRADLGRAASRAGISSAQSRVLELLRSAPDGMRLGEIALRLGVTAASASDTVAGLSVRRLVVRRRDPEDGRAYRFLARDARRQPTGERSEDNPTLAALENAVATLPPGDRASLQRSIVRLILELQDRRLIPLARACVSCRFFRPRVHASPEAPHHCDYVDRPFGDDALRVLCPEFSLAPPEAVRGNRAALARG